MIDMSSVKFSLTQITQSNMLSFRENTRKVKKRQIKNAYVTNTYLMNL